VSSGCLQDTAIYKLRLLCCNSAGSGGQAQAHLEKHGPLQNFLNVGTERL